jgi:hypothetical protein
MRAAAASRPTACRREFFNEEIATHIAAFGV